MDVLATTTTIGTDWAPVAVIKPKESVSTISAAFANIGTNAISDIRITVQPFNVVGCPDVPYLGGADFTGSLTGNLSTSNIQVSTNGAPAILPGQNSLITFKQFFYYRVTIWLRTGSGTTTVQTFVGG